MKKRLFHTLVLLSLLSAVAVSCGDDDDISIDRAYTQVTYKLNLGINLTRFYDIKVYYTDFNGVAHEEEVKNTNSWEYRESAAGDHLIKGRCVATAKSDWKTNDMETLDLTYSYSIHWYKEKNGAHSEQPGVQGSQVSASNIEKYLADHPSITIFSIER